MKNLVLLLIPALFFLMFSYGCKKKSNPVVAPHPDYTANMGGIRHWSGTYSWKYPQDITDSSRAIIDTQYTIQRYSADTVNAFGIALGFNQWDSTVKTVTYGYHDQFMEFVTYLTYFYEKDSMVYHNSFQHHGFGNSLDLHTK